MSTEESNRLYILARADIKGKALDMAAFAASACAQTLLNAENAGLLEEYLNSGQPKIGIKAKNSAAMLRAKNEIEEAGIPCSLILQKDEPMFLTVGLTKREALPPFVRKMQLFAMANEDALETELGLSEGENKIWVFVRADLEMPEGKLFAQVSHGVWEGLSCSTKQKVKQWQEEGCCVQCAAIPDYQTMLDLEREAAGAGVGQALITDAAHTVFTQPTPTVVALGPCTFESLPEAAKRYIEDQPKPGFVNI